MRAQYVSWTAQIISEAQLSQRAYESLSPSVLPLGHGGRSDGVLLNAGFGSAQCGTLRCLWLPVAVTRMRDAANPSATARSLIPATTPKVGELQTSSSRSQDVGLQIMMGPHAVSSFEADVPCRRDSHKTRKARYRAWPTRTHPTSTHRTTSPAQRAM